MVAYHAHIRIVKINVYSCLKVVLNFSVKTMFLVASEYTVLYIQLVVIAIYILLLLTFSLYVNALLNNSVSWNKIMKYIYSFFRMSRQLARTLLRGSQLSTRAISTSATLNNGVIGITLDQAARDRIHPKIG